MYLYYFLNTLYYYDIVNCEAIMFRGKMSSYLFVFLVQELDHTKTVENLSISVCENKIREKSKQLT